MPMVDVRDVAQAHLKAILVPEAANMRFMLVSEARWFQDLGLALHEKWGAQYPKLVHKSMGKWLIVVASWFSADAGEARKSWGKRHTYDNSQTREILGIDFIMPKQSVCEMSETLIQTGYIPAPKAKKWEKMKQINFWISALII